MIIQNTNKQMKKYFFLAVLCCLFTRISLAQSSPMAPTDYKSKVINSTLLYKAIGDVNIPVYLTSARNATIQYCWYSTESQWGSRVRTSENPIRTEQGTYINGRLSDYKGESYFYKISWSSSGVITAIDKYNSSGNHYATYTLSSIGVYWTDYKNLRSPGKGLSGPTYKHISSVLLNHEYADNSAVVLSGYCISGGWLCKEIKRAYLGDVRGQIAKGWIDCSGTSNLRKINPDGSFDGEKCFELNNRARCDYHEF